MRKNVLGFPVDIINRGDSLNLISDWIDGKSKMRLIVTAYSEFFVRALQDNDFGKVLSSADLVTPDGVSVLAAVRYSEKVKNKNGLEKLFEGLKVGSDILSQKVGETVTGVWLFENLTKMAENKGWKIFLLGGWNNVCGRTAQILLKRFPKIKVEYDEGETRVGTDEKTNERVIEKINRFAPDILFVSYNPIKQEKWLAKNRNVLKAKVGIGVGGTFDEYTGRVKKSPLWMERMGLKWLWRVLVEPKRIGRIMRAVWVFPCLVFKSK